MTWDENTPLVSSAEVHQICTELPSSTSADVFINVAHITMCQTFASVTSVSDSRLKLIELYLASHFAAVSNPVASFEGTGKLQESAQFKVDLGFNFTKYGQQAIALDTSGTLRAMAEGKAGGGPRILSLDPTSTEAAQFAVDKEVDRAGGDY